MDRRAFCELMAVLALAGPATIERSQAAELADMSREASAGAAEFAQAFLNPPGSAKPRTWWHWTGGNVTLDGITKDLEWMKRVGIAGCNLIDVSFGHGQVVKKKILFGTPAWLDAVRYAAAECQRLGLEMGMDSSPGWSEAGGPWVKPHQAMKKVVWSEAEIKGPRHFTGKLPHPPTVSGPIRDLGNPVQRIPGMPPPPPQQTYYADSVVLAYRTPADEVPMMELNPEVTTSGGSIKTDALFDGNLNTFVTLPAAKDGTAWLQFKFATPYTARAFTIGSQHGGIPVGRLLASEDGTTFETLVVLPGPQGYFGAPVRTYAFPAVRARVFRLELTDAPLLPAAVIHGGPITPAQNYMLTEAMLYSGARVNRWEDKACYCSLMDVYEVAPTPPVSPAAEIHHADIINLTAKMAADGSLDWEVPEGKWTVLRMGYSLTGAKNHPDIPAATGLEVDKFSPQYVEDYFRGYTDPIAKALGPLWGKTLCFMTMDSWEAGMQNWTDTMIADFHQRRGYDPTPYLPTLAGRVVGTSDISDRFLWDFRRTIADLYADGYYATMEKMLRQNGMISYAEAAGIALDIPEDTLLDKSKVDIPMAEFWVHHLHPEPMYYADVRQAASAAHVYGKPIVATESFTGGWYEPPFTLKGIADYWFAQGVNRIVFHTSAEQPLDTKPGNMMVGTFIDRNITWAGLAKPFMTYIARTCFMLQQGKYVADVAYLLKEGVPSTMPFWGDGLQPAPPAGYDYDVVNTDVLLTRMSVGDDGRLVLPDGMSYRVLVLPEVSYMTLPVLRKIHALVAGGATVLGHQPLRSPNLVGYPANDTEIEQLAMDLWGGVDGVTNFENHFGKGTVYDGITVEEVLSRLKVPRDFEASRPLGSDLVWIHRQTKDGHIYFVVNHTDHAQNIEVSLRVTGKEAELWHADTGMKEPAGYTIANGRTTVPLHLAERESVFVVFRHNTTVSSRKAVRPARTELARLHGPWEITFPPNLGAPPKVQLAKLESWTENSDKGVKYFSGTAAYTKTFQAPQAWFRPGAKLLLDLGMVKDIAVVTLNGKEFGILWKPPYVVDVSAALKLGSNLLEVQVTNEWTNRIIGDNLLPLDKRVLPGDRIPMFPFGASHQHANQHAAPHKSAPPRHSSGGNMIFGPQTPVASGLLGPVQVISVSES